MNYKHIFPTFRSRYNFVRDRLKVLSQYGPFQKGLNLGTGEGDYDKMIAGYCSQLTAVDINEADVNFARQMNKETKNLDYRVDDALKLSFADNAFDLLISIEVIEHVGKPDVMMKEIARVLKPEGIAIITFPSINYPFTYDPINRILSFFSKRRIPLGAYGFGHDYLVSRKEFITWATANQLEIIEEVSLGGYLTGLIELYWPGALQKILKANSNNLYVEKEKKFVLRPSTKVPWLSKLTDFIIFVDRMLFGWLKVSVCRGFVLRRNG